MIKKSWDEFRDTGLLWFINTILHMFGYAIVLEVDKGTVIDAFPARVGYRGFSESDNTAGYTKVSQYLSKNIDKLLEESRE